MKKIVPSLWFDANAEEVVAFYISVFKDSKVLSMSRYTEAGPGPAGSVMAITFQLHGQEFLAINGGPEFTFTPAVSFLVNCATAGETEALFSTLSEGGKALMPLGCYPFSEKFGWVEDRFGLSWQVNFGPRAQKITPFLMFVGEQYGRVEEAIDFYISVFANSHLESIRRFPTEEGEKEGGVQHAVFSLNGQEFMAMESDKEHPFSFTPAVSLMIPCQTQAEVDAFWEKLLVGGSPLQCGWLADKFGLSWQVTPTILMEMMLDRDVRRVQRVTEAMMGMVKLDIAALKRAYAGEMARAG